MNSTTKALKKYLNLLFFGAAYLLPAQYALAQNNQNTPENHERWYQVEMIVFSRNESSTQQEVWPNNIKLEYPYELITLKSVGSNDPNGFNLLAPNERLLNTQASSIAKSGSYSLLFHQAWRQMIEAKNTSIFISGGKLMGSHHELEGSISLSVAQFLKLNTNLWLTQFLPLNAATGNAEINKSEAWPELPKVPNSDVNASEMQNEYSIARIVKMNQQRSMRSVEVHYIDHPLLGIIIKIIPYDLPNQLKNNNSMNQ